MGDEEKELCKPAQIALVLILETATCIMGSKERACQLPLFVYMAEKMCALCYERAWYSKLGGCTAIKFMFERMGRRWILQHQFMFLKALVFVMMDLTSEVWLFNSFWFEEGFVEFLACFSWNEIAPLNTIVIVYVTHFRAYLKAAQSNAFSHFLLIWSTCYMCNECLDKILASWAT